MTTETQNAGMLLRVVDSSDAPFGWRDFLDDCGDNSADPLPTDHILRIAQLAVGERAEVGHGGAGGTITIERIR